MDKQDKLEKLYKVRSKHSQYQTLASNFDEIIKERIQPSSYKYEKERLSFIEENVDFDVVKKAIDIGGNTGYFSFEVLNRMKSGELDYYEGNFELYEFVHLAADVLKMNDRLHVHNEYYEFKDNNAKYDLGLLLNVVHHLGYDFGKSDFNMEEAKRMMLDSINSFSFNCKVLAFQIGFNWGGDVSKCLYKDGTKREMIDWLKGGTKDYWDIVRIGIAEKTEDGLNYSDLNDRNIGRIDELGEFLNRPLFIMKSKSFRD